MKLNISHKIHDDYVHIHIQGSFELKGVLEAYSLAYELAENNGLSKALVDFTTVENKKPTETERYQQGLHVAEVSAKYEASIRLAVAHNYQLTPEWKIGELAARNRGARVRVFTDFDQAFKWLDVVDLDPNTNIE